MAGRKYSNQTGKRKPREELNIGPATPIGRGDQPLDPDAHRIARNLAAGVVFGAASPLYTSFAVPAGVGATGALAKHGKRFGLKKTKEKKK